VRKVINFYYNKIKPIREMNKSKKKTILEGIAHISSTNNEKVPIAFCRSKNVSYLCRVSSVKRCFGWHENLEYSV